MKYTQLHQIIHNIKNVAPVCATHTYGRVEIQFHSFVISVLDGCKWSASSLYLIHPQGKEPWQPLLRRLSRHHSQSGHFGETIILLLLPERE